MERYTVRDEKGIAMIKQIPQTHGLLSAEKFATYEEMEEQGRLIMLPCEVGDTVYKLCHIGSHIKIGDMCDGRIVKTNCDRCGYGNCGCNGIIPKEPNAVTELPNRSLKWILAHRDDFGKAIYLTSEKAKAELERVQGS